MVEKIKEMSKTNINSGDVVIVKAQGSLTPDQKEHLYNILKGAFPDNKAVVLDSDMELEIGSQERVKKSPPPPPPIRLLCEDTKIRKAMTQLRIVKRGEKFIVQTRKQRFFTRRWYWEELFTDRQLVFAGQGQAERFCQRYLKIECANEEVVKTYNTTMKDIFPKPEMPEGWPYKDERGEMEAKKEQLTEGITALINRFITETGLYPDVDVSKVDVSTMDTPDMFKPAVRVRTEL